MADIALSLCPSRATVRNEIRRAWRTPTGTGVQHVRTVNERPAKVHALTYANLSDAQADELERVFREAKACVLPVDLTLPDASLVEVHLPRSITIRSESPQDHSCSLDAEEVR